MGQCSTLPAEGRTSSTSVAYQDSAEQRHRLKDEGRKESLDFNKLISPEQLVDQEAPKQQAMKRSYSPSRKLDISFETQQQPQTRDPEQPTEETTQPEPMEIDSREEAPASIPQPPEIAVRTRCYKLNLDSMVIGLPSSQKQHLWLGPFSEPPPQLTYSSSEDSSEGVNTTSVAIRTAQIFRGITISRDGTILTQNARATRSNRGNKTKRGEKSRQAAKIDKAKDLVEETILTGKAPDSDTPANMVSLVIVGEYDDMKHLVRDGSKKLRDAIDLPDEALFTINRPRATSQRSKSASSLNGGVSAKKRVSPSLVNSQRTAAQRSPEKVQVQASIPQSAPPKLKSHPRDNRSGRREDRTGMRMRFDSCQPGAVAGDGDWSHAWNIWNCGGTGTVSPQQTSSPKEGTNPVFEGRDSAFGAAREGGVTNRTT